MGGCDVTDDPRDDFEPVREWQASVEFTATPRVERDLDDILGDLLDALHDRDGVPGHHQPDDGRGVYSASLTVRGASMFAASQCPCFRDITQRSPVCSFDAPRTCASSSGYGGHRLMPSLKREREGDRPG